MKKVLKTILVLIVVVSCFASCKKTGQQKTKHSVSNETNPYVLTTGVVHTLAPSECKTPIEFFIINQIYEGLYRYDDNGAITNAVSKAEMPNENNTIWTFDIDNNAKWSDGKPITSSDFLFALQYNLQNDSLSNEEKDLLLNIVNVRQFWDGAVDISEVGLTVLSDTSFQLQLTSPVAKISSLMIHPIFFPMREDFGELYSSRDLNDFLKIPVNGRYYIVSATGKQIDFALNTKNTSTEKTKTKEFHVQFIPNMSEMHFSDSQEYFVFLDAPISIDSNDYKLIPVNSYGATFLRFNYSDPETGNSSLRQALQLSLRNQSIASEMSVPVLPARGLLSDSFSSPTSGTNYWTNNSHYLISDSTYSNNILVANNMFDSLSTKPSSLTLIYDKSNPLHQELSTVIQNTWKNNINISIPVIGLNHQDYQNHLQRGDFTIALESFKLSTDSPVSALKLFESGSSENYGHFSSISYDLLYQKCINTSSYQDYCTACLDAESVLFDDAAIVPILEESDYYLVSSSFTSYVITPSGAVVFK